MPVADLAPLLKDPDIAVRIHVALLLSVMGPDARPPLPALKESLQDKHPHVRVYAALALCHLNEDARPLLPILLQSFPLRDFVMRQPIHDALRRYGPHASAAIPVLQDSLKDPVTLHRVQAAETLCAIDANKVRLVKPMLLAIVRSNAKPTNMDAALILCKIERPCQEAIDLLAQEFADAHPFLRQQAAQVLGRLGADAMDCVPASCCY